MIGQAQRGGRGTAATQRRGGHTALSGTRDSGSLSGASRHRTTEHDPLGQLDSDLYAGPDVVSPALDTSRPSVALSIGPYYQATLDASDRQQRLEAELADTEARHDRARAKRHETALRWWNEVSTGSQLMFRCSRLTLYHRMTSCLSLSWCLCRNGPSSTLPTSHFLPRISCL